jgi:hypothetical protein
MESSGVHDAAGSGLVAWVIAVVPCRGVEAFRFDLHLLGECVREEHCRSDEWLVVYRVKLDVQRGKEQT